MSTDKTTSTEEASEIAPDTENLADFEKLWNGEATEPEEAADEAEEVEGYDDESAEAVEEQEELEEEEVIEEEADASEESGDDAPAKPKKSGYQKRIDELTADKWEAVRRADKLEARLQLLEEQREKKAETAPEPEQPADGAPDPHALTEDGEPVYPFGDADPAYIRDLTLHAVRKENEKIRAEEQERAQQEAQQRANAELAASWREKADAFAEATPDFAEKVEELDREFVGVDEPTGVRLMEAIMTSDKGPEVLYHLANNPGLANELAQGGLMNALMGIGRIEAELMMSSESAPKQTKKPTKAPAPPQARSRGASGKYAPPPDTDDLDAFSKHYWNR